MYLQQDREVMLHNAKVHEDMSTIFGQRGNPNLHSDEDVTTHNRSLIFSQVRNSSAQRRMLPLASHLLLGGEMGVTCPKRPEYFTKVTIPHIENPLKRRL